jgi:interleukin-1 receptor-associated kinase 1
VIAFLIYKWRRRHLSAYDTVEEFLHTHNNLMPVVRYSYSEIKKMTRGFQEKLGEGGFGCV